MNKKIRKGKKRREECFLTSKGGDWSNKFPSRRYQPDCTLPIMQSEQLSNGLENFAG